MLHLLRDYAQKQGIALEPGFKPVTVHWAILCGGDGRYYGVVPLGEATGKAPAGRQFSMAPELSQGEMKSGGVLKSQFLADSVSTVALLAGPDAKNAPRKHAYFVGLLKDAAGVMPELAGAAACLENQNQLEVIRRDLAEHKAKRTEKITFQIDDAFPLDSSAWHGWWRTFRRGMAAERRASARDSGPARMRCFVTGDLIHPAATHPKIEGLADVGGATAGSPLVGFNKPSYCSYGLEQSSNAAVSAEAAAAYRVGLNQLIRRHGQRIAGAKVVHWFEGRVEEADNPLPWLLVGRAAEEAEAQQRAAELLTAIRSGKRPDLAHNRYYALTLSGASGRVMVRDWIEGQFEELVEHVKAWFDDLAILHLDGTMAKEPRFLDVLRATVRDDDDLTSPFVARMWRAAVRCEPIPRSALAATLRRWQADLLTRRNPNPRAVGLMKAYHLRIARSKEVSEVGAELTPHLNDGHPEAAYHCGRLMAVLAALQKSALPDVSAGVVQRYYAAASATPALVLGRLTRMSQFHLGKLSPGLAYWYEQRLASVWSRIDGKVPATTTLEQQSLFALGYYHQMVALRTKEVTGDKTEEDGNHE